MSATFDRAMDNTSSKSRLSQRKFSGAMSRISSSTFSRRRNTTTTLPSSVSSIQLNHQSRLPTPSGIPKSTSFLCSLNHFNHPSIDENQPPQLIERRRLPERSSGEPSSSRQTSQIPRAASRTGPKPDCSVKIEQRGLMQPMQPPLPRSSTMGHLSSSQSLGVLQENTSTSGIDARNDIRRQSIVLNKRNHNLTPPTRIVKLQKSTSSGAFPKRKDSLMAPPPATAIAPVHYAAVLKAVAPQRAVSYDEEDTVIISKDSPPTPPPKTKPRTAVRNISHFQEELGETEETDLHHTSTVPPSPMPRSPHDYRPRSPPLAPTAYDQDDDPRFVYHAQQPTYWLGRYTALADIFHTSALPEPIPTITDRGGDKAARMPMPFSSATSSSSDGFFNGGKHPMQDQATRLQHVRMQLRLSCVTEDAIQSFRLFEEMMEEVMGEPEKKAPRTSAGVKEKKGWLEGLMARRKSSNTVK